MTTRYTVTLCDNRGRKLRPIEATTWGRIALRVNDVGTFALGLPDYYFNSFEVRDSIFQIDRSVDGRAPRSFYFFSRRDQISREDKGAWRYEVSGYDFNYLLLSRIIAYAATTTYAEKTDSADDVIKAFIRENLGALATDTARDLTSYGLAVEADAGAGVSLTKAAAWRGLLRTCQGVADASVADGTAIFFGIVVTGRATTGELQFEFRTRANQWGQDLTGGKATLSAQKGNLRTESVERDYGKEVTTVYGLGAGRDTTRLTATASETGRRDATPYSRHESPYDNPQMTTSAALTDAANERAIEGRPVLRLAGEVAETASWHYGENYAIGDKLSMQSRGLLLPVWVMSVGLSWVARREIVRAKVVSTTGIGTSGGSGGPP